MRIYLEFVMDIATLASKLRALEFDILDIKKIANGQQIRLACGAVISVFDTGTVLVQGKLHEYYRERASILLKHILPPTTRWCIN